MDPMSPKITTKADSKLKIHNRRPVALIKPSGQPDTFVLERAG